MTRSTASDGFANRVEKFLLTHFKPLWHVAQAVPPVDRWLNGVLIDRAVNKCASRPNPLSLMSDYPSWFSLTDRIFSGRHLPPATADYMDRLPPIDRVLDLFRRPGSGPRLSPKSTVLFSNFAQWFTDGFLRTDLKDFHKNTSNHEIDISPLYGRTRVVADALRTNDGSGHLKSQHLPPKLRGDGTQAEGYGGGEFPLYYFDDDFVTGKSDAGQVRPEFQHIKEELALLPYENALLEHRSDRMRHRFAMGVERANNQIGYVLMNVLFLREHNRLCDLLRRKHPGWDGDRIYHTARNAVTVMLLKIVVEEYINHISPFHFQFRAQPKPFYQARWYHTNWITVEFNLLYRWHGLVPDHIDVGQRQLPLEETLFHNSLLIEEGLANTIDSASHQKAGEVGLMNTAPYLVKAVEQPSLELGRHARLRSYNDYREYAKYPRARNFDEITGDEERQRRLADVYGTPDNMEFFVGLFAEDVAEHSALPPLIGRLVAVDAFSQALTNPLLSERVFLPETFAEGWDEIQKTSTLGDVVGRNTPGERQNVLASMTQK